MNGISVIIPTLNEAARIGETVARTRTLGRVEILVVDGGSSDGTLELAAAADQCLATAAGRGRQQNAGAAAARGDVLLFLHADCWLEPGAVQEIQDALADPRCVGGCFRQVVEAAGWKYRLIEAGNAGRVRCFGWAYGDQGIFVRRDIFLGLGGFPDIPLLEDLYFSKRLKLAGRVALLSPRLHVSPRRWQRHGIVRQTLHNWMIIALAHCGVSPARLANWYATVR